MRMGRSFFDLPLRVTFYARVSTDQDEQLNSLENQVQYYTELIKSKPNWTFVPGYIDEGISGTSTKKRDDFNRMIRDAKAGLFDFIITKEISRFSRSTLDSIKYTQELLEHNVGVFFQNDNINTLDTDSEFRLVIMAGVAQDEVRKLSERLKFGFRQAIKNGHVLGNDKLYGYRVDTTDAFPISNWDLDFAGVYQEVQGFAPNELIKQRLQARDLSNVVNFSSCDFCLELFTEKDSQVCEQFFLEPFKRIQEIPDAYIDGFLNTLCYFYPDYVGDFFKRYIAAVKQQSVEYIKTKR